MYEILFTPRKIGKMEVKNRFVVSAAVTRLAHDDGSCSEAFIKYQEDKARGGWGLIIPEHFAVSEDQRTYLALPRLITDAQVDSYKELTQRIHDADSKIFAQLYHPGRSAVEKVTGFWPQAPSAIINPPYTYLPKELSQEEINQIVADFAHSALGAKKAGFDGVEIHGAHGYLIHQFLSGNTNKRIDKYGGGLLNRNRFLLEVIEAVRQAVGEDFPLSLRLSIQDYVPNGISVEESIYTAKLAENSGVDVIHASAGTMENSYCIIPPSASPKAVYLNNASRIRDAVNIPVIAVGRINEAGLAEQAISGGHADFVAMLRSSVADPEMPLKIKEGRMDEIHLCIGCMQGCLGQNSRLEPFTCLVRPLTGHAHELEIKPAEISKKIMIIGAGVSGCETAVYAAKRGHEVNIFDKRANIGGRWIAASIPPGKADYVSVINWHRHMMEKYGVKVHLNEEIDLAKVESFLPDVVILAAGADDLIPPIPGRDLGHVVKAEEILLGEKACGDRVVVVGGGLVGAETADYIARYANKKVTVVEMLPEIMADGEPGPKHYLMESFKTHGVDIHTSSMVKEIKEDSLVFENEGELVELAADTVVMATGLRVNDHFYDELVGAGLEVIKVGDAASAQNALCNIREGFVAGITI